MKRNKIMKVLLLALSIAALLSVGCFAAEVGESFAYNTLWAALPPIIAIGLALITKEVYSSLFLGIAVGAAMYANFNFMGTITHIFDDGIIMNLSDSWNVGILVFDVLLGFIVQLINAAGGSAAFGKWGVANIKSRVSAQLCVVALGCLIFIDDYFNCLTVGSVMRPLTDKHNISRPKLAYLIDATAAPICIIAPISSWAAAVSGFVDGVNGLALFVSSSPYNFYALLTIVMMIALSVMNFDFGPMKKAEAESNTAKESEKEVYASLTGADPAPEDKISTKGTVLHLVGPVLVLIISCVIGMIYTGGFFEGTGFVDAFAGSDASVGLVYGSVVALILTIVFYLATRVLSFRECMTAIPEGFKSMVPAILILTFAWTLKSMTDSLGAADYVAGIVESSAGNLIVLLPAIVFLVGCFLAFATGTSWGTFGILIPIVVSVFGGNMDNTLMVVSISACMAGAVCGDHCSPISDTTIMASAGAQCDHIAHVNTQLPYAITAAAISLVCYLLTGVLFMAGIAPIIMLPVGIVLTVVLMGIIKKATAKAA